jgi:hypothetical protein
MVFSLVEGREYQRCANSHAETQKIVYDLRYSQLGLSECSLLQPKRRYFSLYEIFTAVKIRVVSLKSIRLDLGCDSVHLGDETLPDWTVSHPHNIVVLFTQLWEPHIQLSPINYDRTNFDHYGTGHNDRLQGLRSKSLWRWKMSRNMVFILQGLLSEVGSWDPTTPYSLYSILT